MFSGEGEIVLEGGVFDPFLDDHPSVRRKAFFDSRLLLKGGETITTVSTWFGTVTAYSESLAVVSRFQINHPFLDAIRQANLEYVRRDAKGAQQPEKAVMTYMVAGAYESSDGNLWIATNTAPYVGLFKVDPEGQVLETFAWKHDDKGIHAGHALILDSDTGPKVFISDPFNGLVYVLEP
jgi:hypothetical protein